MNEKEYIAKYCVPSYDTCKELKWKDRVVFSWAYVWKEPCIIEYSPYHPAAPQFHEIWAKLPKSLMGMAFEDIEESEHLLTVSDSFISYAHQHWVDAYKVEIQNNNLAEAAAQLYLQLKTDGKL